MWECHSMVVYGWICVCESLRNNSALLICPRMCPYTVQYPAWVSVCKCMHVCKYMSHMCVYVCVCLCLPHHRAAFRAIKLSQWIQIVPLPPLQLCWLSLVNCFCGTITSYVLFSLHYCHYWLKSQSAGWMWLWHKGKYNSWVLVEKFEKKNGINYSLNIIHIIYIYKI